VQVSSAHVRVASREDVDEIGRLLHDFNVEFGEPSPSPFVLAKRLHALLETGETVVLLVGGGPDGVAVLRFRPAIWSSGLECYLAELYVVPALRGRGLGRALLESAIAVARSRGADTMDVGVDEPDTVARHLYERCGFTNRVDGPRGPVTYVYERAL
jgi:GNAT superfamily N-acetyltransferase